MRGAQRPLKTLYRIQFTNWFVFGCFGFSRIRVLATEWIVSISVFDKQIMMPFNPIYFHVGFGILILEKSLLWTNKMPHQKVYNETTNIDDMMTTPRANPLPLDAFKVLFFSRLLCIAIAMAGIFESTVAVCDSKCNERKRVFSHFFFVENLSMQWEPMKVRVLIACSSQVKGFFIKRFFRSVEFSIKSFFVVYFSHCNDV